MAGITVDQLKSALGIAAKKEQVLQEQDDIARRAREQKIRQAEYAERFSQLGEYGKNVVPGMVNLIIRAVGTDGNSFMVTELYPEEDGTFSVVGGDYIPGKTDTYSARQLAKLISSFENDPNMAGNINYIKDERSWYARDNATLDRMEAEEKAIGTQRSNFNDKNFPEQLQDVLGSLSAAVSPDAESAGRWSSYDNMLLAFDTMARRFQEEANAMSETVKRIKDLKDAEGNPVYGQDVTQQLDEYAQGLNKRAAAFTKSAHNLRVQIRGRVRGLDDEAEHAATFSSAAKKELTKAKEELKRFLEYKNKRNQHEQKTTNLTESADDLRSLQVVLSRALKGAQENLSDTEQKERYDSTQNLISRLKKKGLIDIDEALSGKLDSLDGYSPEDYLSLNDLLDAATAQTHNIDTELNKHSDESKDIYKKYGRGSIESYETDLRNNVAKALQKVIFSNAEDSDYKRALISAFVKQANLVSDAMHNVDAYTDGNSDANFISRAKDYADWAEGILSDKDIMFKYGDELEAFLRNVPASRTPLAIGNFLRNKLKTARANDNRGFAKALHKYSTNASKLEQLRSLMMPLTGSQQELSQQLNNVILKQQQKNAAEEAFVSAKDYLFKNSPNMTVQEIEGKRSELQALREALATAEEEYNLAQQAVSYEPKYNLQPLSDEDKEALKVRPTDFLESLPEYRKFTDAFNRVTDPDLRTVLRLGSDPANASSLSIEDVAKGRLDRIIEDETFNAAKNRVNKRPRNLSAGLTHLLETKGDASRLMALSPEVSKNVSYMNISGQAAANALARLKAQALDLFPMKDPNDKDYMRNIVKRKEIEDAEDLYDLKAVFKPMRGQDVVYDKMYRKINNDYSKYTAKADDKQKYSIFADFGNVLNKQETWDEINAIAEKLNVSPNELVDFARLQVGDDLVTKIKGDRLGNFMRSAIMPGFEKQHVEDMARNTIAKRYEDRYTDIIGNVLKDDIAKLADKPASVYDYIKELNYTNPHLLTAVLPLINFMLPGTIDNNKVLKQLKASHYNDLRTAGFTREEIDKMMQDYNLGEFYNNDTLLNSVPTIADFWKADIDEMPDGEIGSDEAEQKAALLSTYDKIYNETVLDVLPAGHVHYDENNNIALTDEQKALYGNKIKAAFRDNVYEYLKNEEVAEIYDYLNSRDDGIDKALKQGSTTDRQRALAQAAVDYIRDLGMAQEQGVLPREQYAWENYLKDNIGLDGQPLTAEGKEEILQHIANKDPAPFVTSTWKDLLQNKKDSKLNISDLGYNKVKADEKDKTQTTSSTNGFKPAYMQDEEFKTVDDAYRRIKTRMAKTGEELSSSRLKKLTRLAIDAGVTRKELNTVSSEEELMTLINDRKTQKAQSEEKKPDIKKTKGQNFKTKPKAQRAIEETQEAIAAQGTPFDEEETQEAIEAVEQVDPTLLDKYSVDSDDDTTDTINLGAMAAHLQHETNPFEAPNETTIYDATKEEQKDE